MGYGPMPYLPGRTLPSVEAWIECRAVLPSTPLRSVTPTRSLPCTRCPVYREPAVLPTLWS